VIQRGELGNTSGYAATFKALARQSPGGVWLTGVSINGAGNELGVQGRAREAALVPAYLGRLAHEPVMRGKAFGSLKISQPAAKDAQFVEFSLEATPPAQAAQ
jgi:Tfp pilus assembly protein PilN